MASITDPVRILLPSSHTSLYDLPMNLPEKSLDEIALSTPLINLKACSKTSRIKRERVEPSHLLRDFIEQLRLFRQPHD
jgi:hypothetical protein